METGQRSDGSALQMHAEHTYLTHMTERFERHSGHNSESTNEESGFEHCVSPVQALCRGLCVKPALSFSPFTPVSRSLHTHSIPIEIIFLSQTFPYVLICLTSPLCLSLHLSPSFHYHLHPFSLSQLCRFCLLCKCQSRRPPSRQLNLTEGPYATGTNRSKSPCLSLQHKRTAHTHTHKMMHTPGTRTTHGDNTVSQCSPALAHLIYNLPFSGYYPGKQSGRGVCSNTRLPF